MCPGCTVSLASRHRARKPECNSGLLKAVKPSTTSSCSVRGPQITLLDKKDLVMLALPPAKEEKVGSAVLEWPRSELTESNRKESLRVLSTPDRASIKVIVL